MRPELHGSLRIALVGTMVGLLIAVWTARLLSQFLFGVMAWDPVTYAAVALILIVVSLVASYMPARRVTRVDPVEVLRTE